MKNHKLTMAIINLYSSRIAKINEQIKNIDDKLHKSSGSWGFISKLFYTSTCLDFYNEMGDLMLTKIKLSSELQKELSEELQLLGYGETK